MSSPKSRHAVHPLLLPQRKEVATSPAGARKFSIAALRVAIVHDTLVVNGGAERVLAELLDLFPDADLFTTVCFLGDNQRDFLRGRNPKTTFIQRMPWARKHYRLYLPLMPLAIEQLDLTNYDLIISSSYAVAKGVITGPDQLHISYVHSPIRYAWDLQHIYLREARLDRGLRSIFARIVLHYMRLWDYRTGSGADAMIANSHFVARRIRKIYGRQAVVIPPPVDVDRFMPGDSKEEFFLTASRMVPYKCIPLIVEAFAAMPDKRLVVIGDGPDMPAVRLRAASAPNIDILGYQPEPTLIDYMQRARAFVFAAEEDFGIVPLEAQACGTPVIALGKGGALETVRGNDGPNRTGTFFLEQSVAAIVQAVREFDDVCETISPSACRENAMRFHPIHFRNAFMQQIKDEIAKVFA